MNQIALQTLSETANTLTVCLDRETAAITSQNWAVMTETQDAKRQAVSQFEAAWATATGADGFDEPFLVDALQPIWERLDCAVNQNLDCLVRAINTQDQVIATVLHALDDDAQVTNYAATPNKPTRPVALTTRV